MAKVKRVSNKVARKKIAAKKKALKPAAELVKKAIVKPRVLGPIELEAIRNRAPEGNIAALRAGDESLKLQADLNIDATGRAFLAVDYSAISQSYGGFTIGPRSARDATDVNKAIELVHKRANKKI